MKKYIKFNALFSKLKIKNFYLNLFRHNINTLSTITKYISLCFLLVSGAFISLYIGDWFIGQQRLIKDLKQSSPPPRYMPLREHLLNYDTNWTPSDDYIKLYTDSLEQKPYRIRTNSEGFIIGPDDLGRDHEKLDIIFYGGSTTECGFVDENIRFPYLVSKMLKHSVGGGNIRTLNAGVSGMNSMHTVLSVIGKGIPQKPSYIVFMHAINDLSLLTKTYSYWNAPLEKELVHNSTLIGNKVITDNKNNYINKLILKYFPNIWLTVNELIINSNKVASLRNHGMIMNKLNQQNQDEIDKIFKIQFTAAIKSFIHISRAWGIEPILMTQFNRIKIDDELARRNFSRENRSMSYEEFVILYQQANNMVRQIAKEEDVFLIDLERSLPGTSLYIYDAVHLNNKGSVRVAKIIADEIAKKYTEFEISPL